MIRGIFPNLERQTSTLGLKCSGQNCDTATQRYSDTGDFDSHCRLNWEPEHIALNDVGNLVKIKNILLI